MGSFANSVFNMLLGWLRSAASALWAMVTGQGSAQVFAWFGENWLALTLVICAVCTLVDVIVHLFRWRSYKVWASFLRRLTGAEKREEKRRAEEKRESERRQQAVVREWIYPDGTARREEVPPEAADDLPLQPWQHLASEEELTAYRQRFARPSSQPITYRRPSAMDQLKYEQVGVNDMPADGPEGYPSAAQPEDAALAPADQPVPDVPPIPVRESIAVQMRRRVAQLQQNLGMNDEDDLIVTYRKVKPIADVKDTYHEPVYPPNWPNGDMNAYTPRRRRQQSETDPVD